MDAVLHRLALGHRQEEQRRVVALGIDDQRLGVVRTVRVVGVVGEAEGRLPELRERERIVAVERDRRDSGSPVGATVGDVTTGTRGGLFGTSGRGLRGEGWVMK